MLPNKDVFKRKFPSFHLNCHRSAEDQVMKYKLTKLECFGRKNKLLIPI